MKRIFLKFGITLVLCMAVSAANATQIPLVNPGFDEVYTDSTMTTPLDLNAHGTLTVGLGSTSAGDGTAAYVPGWVTDNTWKCIIDAPTATMLPDGGYTGYVALGLQGWMAQVVPTTIQPGCYTLTAKIGGRADYHPGSLNMKLEADNTTSWSELGPFFKYTTPGIPWGSFVTWTSKYHVLSTSACVGKPMIILFNILGDQVLIDDVSLDYTPDADTTIGEYRNQPDGTPVDIVDFKAITYGPTATTGGFMYIEDIDRASGIKVIIPDGYANTTTAGDWINLSGTMATDENGERIINLTNYTMMTRLPLSALGTSNKSIASAAGLLVSTWGKVTAVNDTGEKDSWFYVDDGSGLQDGSGNTGLRCTGNWAVNNAVPNIDEYVCVTGVASTQKIGNQTSNLIRTTQFTTVGD